MNIIRVGYNSSTTVEILLGEGSPEWDEEGTEDTDLWLLVKKAHVTAIRPPTPRQRVEILRRFVDNGAPPLVLQAQDWRHSVGANAPPGREVSTRPLKTCRRCAGMAADERKVGRCAEPASGDGYMPTHRSLQGKAARDMYRRSRVDPGSLAPSTKPTGRAYCEQE